MKIKSISAFIILAVASCSTPIKVFTTADKTVDFSSYKTFDFYEITEQQLPLKEVNRRRLAMAIELELGYKGIKRSVNDPDLLVNLYSAMNRREVTGGNTGGVGYYGAAMPYGAGVGISVSPPSSFSTTYTRGTVKVDLVDRQENRLVVRGIATIDARENDNAVRMINYTVKDVFKDIPDQIKR